MRNKKFRYYVYNSLFGIEGQFVIFLSPYKAATGNSTRSLGFYCFFKAILRPAQ